MICPHRFAMLVVLVMRSGRASPPSFLSLTPYEMQSVAPFRLLVGSILQGNINPPMLLPKVLRFVTSKHTERYCSMPAQVSVNAQ